MISGSCPREQLQQGQEGEGWGGEKGVPGPAGCLRAGSHAFSGPGGRKGPTQIPCSWERAQVVLLPRLSPSLDQPRSPGGRAGLRGAYRVGVGEWRWEAGRAAAWCQAHPGLSALPKLPPSLQAMPRLPPKSKEKHVSHPPFLFVSRRPKVSWMTVGAWVSGGQGGTVPGSPTPGLGLGHPTSPFLWTAAVPPHGPCRAGEAESRAQASKGHSGTWSQRHMSFICLGNPIFLPW